MVIQGIYSALCIIKLTQLMRGSDFLVGDLKPQDTHGSHYTIETNNVVCLSFFKVHETRPSKVTQLVPVSVCIYYVDLRDVRTGFFTDML